MVVLPSNKPPEAWAFLNGVRLGQTAPGSYIFRIETPLIGTVERTSSRMVLDQLHQAMTSAHTAAVEARTSDVPSTFAEHVGRGVSANLCGALSKIGALGHSEFEVKFAWAPTLLMEKSTPDLYFDHEAVNQLKKAGQYLRDLPAHREARIEGRVIELRSYRPDQQGTVVVDGVLTTPEGRTAERVIVVLQSWFYERSYQAHPDRKRIRAVGQVKTSGRQPELSSVTEFDIIDD